MSQCVKRYRIAKIIFSQLLSDARTHRDKTELQNCILFTTPTTLVHTYTHIHTLHVRSYECNHVLGIFFLKLKHLVLNCVVCRHGFCNEKNPSADKFIRFTLTPSGTSCTHSPYPSIPYLILQYFIPHTAVFHTTYCSTPLHAFLLQLYRLYVIMVSKLTILFSAAKQYFIPADKRNKN